jgi:hypothetical protein
MARLIANVDILTETFGSWITRTNDIIESLNTEVLTANTTSGITGSISVPRTAVLFGTLKSNTVSVSNTILIGTNLTANTTAVNLGSGVKILANNSFGSLGQVLASSATGVYWTTVSGTGTVTNITAGNGLNGGTITDGGTLSVKPSTGIVVNASGVSVNAAYISTFTSGSATLEGYTWASPARIGSTTANTGAFTTLSSGSYTIPGAAAFLINNTIIRTQGYVDATTPNISTTGGYRLRGFVGGPAYFQVTDYLGSTQWGVATITSGGAWSWSGSFSAASALSAASLSASSLNISGATALNSLNVTTASVTNLSVTNGTFSSIGVGTSAPGFDGTISAENGIFSNDIESVTGTFSGAVTSGGSALLKLTDFTQSKSSSGYTKLPNGILIQWGSVPATTSETTSSVTFPLVFTGGVYSVTATSINSGLSSENDYWLQVASLSTSGASFYHNSSDGGSESSPGYYIAVGSVI